MYLTGDGGSSHIGPHLLHGGSGLERDSSRLRRGAVRVSLAKDETDRGGEGEERMGRCRIEN